MTIEQSMSVLVGDLPVYLGSAACFILAALASSLENARRDGLSWGLFAWASLLFGAGMLVWHISGMMPHVKALSPLAGAAVLSSLALLLEFGRRDISSSCDGPFFSPSFYVPAAGLSLAGLVIDFNSIMPMLLFAWSIPAFLATSRVLWRAAQSCRTSLERQLLLAFSFLNLLGGLAFCGSSIFLIVYWPSGGLSLLLLSWCFGAIWAILCLPVAGILLFDGIKEAERTCGIGVRRLFAVSAGLIAGAFLLPVVALYCTERMLKLENFFFERDKLSKAKLVDESINGATTLARGVSELIACAPGIAAYMASPEVPGKEPKWISDLLERLASTLPQGSICYLMDKRGLCVASSRVTGARDLRGRNFAFRNYFKDAMEKGSGSEVTIGVATFEPGFFASTRISSDAGTALGVVVVKLDFHRCMNLAAPDIGLLINPEGFSLLSSNPSFERMDVKDATKRARTQMKRVSENGLPGTYQAVRHSEEPLFITVDSSALPSWRIGVICQPDPVMSSYRIAGMGLAIIASLSFGIAFAMRHADFWNSVAIKRMLAWRDAVLDSQLAGVAILDEAFAIIEANKVFLSLFSLPQDSIKGMLLAPIFRSFRAHESFVKDASSAIASSGSYSKELELQSRNGAEIWCEVSGHRLESVVSETVSVWTFIDRTKSKKDTELLKESEERYRAIFDNAPLGITVYEAKGQCLMANPAYSLIAGGPIASILQQDFRRIKSWQSSGLLGLADATLRDGRTREMMFHSTTSFGKMVTARCVLSSSPLGDSRLLVLMVEDQTAKSEAEHRVEELLSRYEQLFKLMPAAAFTVNCSGMITSVNSMTESLTGYLASELVGSSCRKFTAEPCAEECGLFLSSKSKPVMNRSCVIVTKGGQRRQILKNADLIHDSSGKIVGGIEIFFEVAKQSSSASDIQKTLKDIPLPPPKVLDEGQIDSICMDGRDTLESILSMSPGEFATLYSALEEALSKGDLPSARIAAHSLKGASSNIGGFKMFGLCLEVETAAGRGDARKAKDVLPEIKAAIPELFAALEIHLGRMKG